MESKLRLMALAGTLTLLGAACGGGPAQNRTVPVPPVRSSVQESTHPSPATTRHIVLIVFENKGFSEVIGSGCCPYLNTLAKRGLLATNSFAITHPSLPNYLAMTAGSTFGRTSDDTAPLVKGENLFHQLQKAGVPWKAYQETMPSPCFKGDSAGSDPATYELHHDPAMMFANVSGDPAACANVVPLTKLAGDASAGRLPAFAFITPNNCNNMHSCANAKGDQWLKQWMPKILTALDPNGVAIITFDEGSGESGAERIATLLVGPGVRPGTLGKRITHYSLLAGLEQAFGLPRLGKAKSATPVRIGSG
jgi:phosphatidylinositol-3-phosphatase